jgi:hypothetical protein
MINTRTERVRLMDITADSAASMWYAVQYPSLYVSTRYVQGHEIVVVVANGEMAKRILDAAERRTRRRDE